MENVQHWLVDDGRRWVSLEGRVGMTLHITARTRPLIPLSPLEISIPVLRVLTRS